MFYMKFTVSHIYTNLTGFACLNRYERKHLLALRLVVRIIINTAGAVYQKLLTCCVQGSDAEERR